MGKEEPYYVDHAELARVSKLMEMKIQDSVRKGENCLRFHDADVPVVENLLSWANIRVYRDPRSMDKRIVSDHLIAFKAIQDLLNGGRRQRQIVSPDKKHRSIYYQLDWTKILMLPTQLYVLANRFQIPVLKKKALKYFTSCLKHAKKKIIFRWQPGQKGSFVEAFTQVVNFCFEKLIFLQTPVSFFDLPKAERVEEPILRRLTGFAAKNLARLKNYPEFVGVMEKNPQFCVRLLITGKCPSPPKKKLF